MQKTEIAHQTGWEEDDVDISKSYMTDQNLPIQNAPTSTPPIPPASIQNTTLLDAEDRVAPNQISTEKPIWRHPIPRTVLVVVGVGAIGFSVVRLTEGNGLVHPKPNQVAVAPTPTPKPQTSSDDKGELQARLATIGLQQQIDALKKARLASRSAAKPSSFSNSPTATKPKPVSTATSTARPAVPTNSPPSQYFRPPTVKPASVKLKSTQSSLTQTQPKQQPSPPEDPMETWMVAANIGSYGNIPPGNSTQSANSQSADNTATNSYQTVDFQTSNTATNNSDWQPSGGIGKAPQSSGVKPNQTDSPVAQPSQVNNRNHNQVAQSSQAVNYSTAGDSLVVGARADGKLETPIAWSGDLQNPNQNFLIQLTEPLRASDASVAVSKGAYLVARVNAATSTGIIQMSAVSVLSTQNNRTVEQPLPEGAILVLGKGGQPLQAKTTRRESAGNDIGMVLLSGASTAAGLVNQSTSQSTFNSGGGFQTTITNPKPNYLAGFGQGAAQALVQQMQNRNQRARQSVESQPQDFVLNQGTSVQVFVNQSVSLSES